MNASGTTCPKCGHLNDQGSESCVKCGIIFSKYFEIQQRENKKEMTPPETSAADGSTQMNMDVAGAENFQDSGGGKIALEEPAEESTAASPQEQPGQTNPVIPPPVDQPPPIPPAAAADIQPSDPTGTTDRQSAAQTETGSIEEKPADPSMAAPAAPSPVSPDAAMSAGGADTGQAVEPEQAVQINAPAPSLENESQPPQEISVEAIEAPTPPEAARPENTVDLTAAEITPEQPSPPTEKTGPQPSQTTENPVAAAENQRAEIKMPAASPGTPPSTTNGVTTETTRDQGSAQPRAETAERQKATRAKAAALKKKKLALAKAAALKKQKAALAKAELLRKQRTALAKAETLKKQRAAAARQEAIKNQREAQLKAETQSQQTQAGIGGRAAVHRPAEKKIPQRRVKLTGLLKKYQGQTIGINYDNSADIKAAELVEANDEYFSVRAKDTQLQYSYPLKTLLTVIEGEQGVEAGDENSKTKFSAVIKVFPLVLF